MQIKSLYPFTQIKVKPIKTTYSKLTIDNG